MGYKAFRRHIFAEDICIAFSKQLDVDIVSKDYYDRIILEMKQHERARGITYCLEMICILYGFPCETDFSHHEYPNPTRVACDEGEIRRQVVRNPSHMENHTKCIFSHTLHFKSR